MKKPYMAKSNPRRKSYSGLHHKDYFHIFKEKKPKETTFDIAEDERETFAAEAHHWKRVKSAVQIASSQYDTPHKSKVRYSKKIRVKLPLFWLLFL
jgi:hypothetical protein